MTDHTPTEWPTDRVGMEIMPPEVCEERLAGAEVGRVAMMDSGMPSVFPVAYRFHRGRIVFRTAFGAKLYAAVMQQAVAFEIDEWDKESRTGWSVLVRGHAEEITTESELAELRALDLRPWTDAAEHGRWVQIVPVTTTGRRVPRST